MTQRREVEPAAGAEWLSSLPPVLAPHTRLVVLGSFPGVASLRAQQYYAHPRNQFWPLLSAIWGIDLVGLPYAQRLVEASARGLGLWDVYASCRRAGSLDSAIREAVFNDLASLGQRAPKLQAVAHNGGESARAMRQTQALGVAVIRLPSTSPANASWGFDRKLVAWRAAFAECGLSGLDSLQGLPQGLAAPTRDSLRRKRVRASRSCGST
ncbi:MAG: DNA-deoxyinosine glycosylase [Rhizobacter sp.]